MILVVMNLSFWLFSQGIRISWNRSSCARVCLPPSGIRDHESLHAAVNMLSLRLGAVCCFRLLESAITCTSMYIAHMICKMTSSNVILAADLANIFFGCGSCRAFLRIATVAGHGYNAVSDLTKRSLGKQGNYDKKTKKSEMFCGMNHASTKEVPIIHNNCGF